jgi:hypothetical protein
MRNVSFEAQLPAGAESSSSRSGVRAIKAPLSVTHHTSS